MDNGRLIPEAIVFIKAYEKGIEVKLCCLADEFRKEEILELHKVRDFCGMDTSEMDCPCIEIDLGDL
jgi:hypothetical protein